MSVKERRKRNEARRGMARTRCKAGQDKAEKNRAGLGEARQNWLGLRSFAKPGEWRKEKLGNAWLDWGALAEPSERDDTTLN